MISYPEFIQLYSKIEHILDFRLRMSRFMHFRLKIYICVFTYPLVKVSMRRRWIEMGI